MPSKRTINEAKNKKTKKIKLRLKMLVGQQPIYRQTCWACHQSRHVQPFATSKSQSFPSQKQAVGSFLTLNQLI